MSLKDDCDCGHDRTHHYFDPIAQVRCACLAMRCECKMFQAPGQPKKPPPRPSNHPRSCKCFYCKQHPTPAPAWDDLTDLIDEDPPPTTKPIP